MGVNLSNILIKKTTSLKELKYKKIAFDSYNMLYQFLSSIRQEDGTPLKDLKGNITGHLSGLFYRTAKFLENGLKPVFVFDGKPPSFKEKELEKRKKRKEEAEKKYEEARDLENEILMKRYAEEKTRLGKKEVEEAKALIRAMGLTVIEAPSEGEAEGAYLTKTKVFAVGSQDYDALMFGGKNVVRNLSIGGKRKVPNQNRYIPIEPEIINLEENLKALSINQDQLILIGILVGTDFNEGVPRVGPKTALKIVKEHETLNDVIYYVKNKYNYEFEDYIEDVFNFFKNPPVEDFEIKFRKINTEEVIKILVEEHDFSEERVMNVCKKLEAVWDLENKQKHLSQWF